VRCEDLQGARGPVFLVRGAGWRKEATSYWGDDSFMRQHVVFQRSWVVCCVFVYCVFCDLCIVFDVFSAVSATAFKPSDALAAPC
jgi:hypothetical protein